MLVVQADRHETKPCLFSTERRDREGSIPTGRLFEEITTLAGYLQQAGVTPGNRIAIMSPNHPDMVFQILAAWFIGASVVPIRPDEDTERLAHIFQSSGIRLALVRDVCIKRFPAHNDSSLPPSIVQWESGPRTAIRS